MGLPSTLVYFLFWLATPCFAKWQRNPFDGARPSSMGNAFSAIADDKNLLFYNPAGLNQLKGIHFDLYDIVVGADSNDTVNRLNLGFFQHQNNKGIRTDKEYARFSMFPALLTKYFAAGFFYQFQYFSEIVGLDLPQADVYGMSDLGFITALALPVSNSFSIGVSARVLERTGVDVTTDPTTLLSDVGATKAQFLATPYDYLKKKIRRGWGWGYTVGLLFHTPQESHSNKIGFGLVLSDLMNTSFKAAGNIPAPETIPMNANLGFSYTSNLGNDHLFNFAFDLRNVMSGSLPAMIHFGGEYRLKRFGFRAGISQGYPTFGFGYQVPSFQLLFSSTASELSSQFLGRSVRWYLVQVVLGIHQ